MANRLADILVKFSGDVTDLRSKMSIGERAVEKFGEKTTRVGRTMSAALTLPLIGAGVLAARSAIQLDSLTRGLAAVAGSAGAAYAQMKDLREVARLPGLSFKEAIQGATRLQAVGFSAAQSARILREFGNAVATTGGSGHELDRVIVQLSQLSSKGRILTQDLRPIIEVAPIVGTALKRAFGSVDAEAIGKQVKNSEEFIDRLLTELGKLERVTGGPKNALENLRDTTFLLANRIGTVLIPAITAGTDKLSKWSEKAIGARSSTIAWALGIGAAIAVIGPAAIAVGSLTTALATLSAAVSVGILPLLGIGGAVVIGLSALVAWLIKAKLEAQQFAASITQSANEIAGAAIGRAPTQDKALQELARARREHELTKKELARLGSEEISKRRTIRVGGRDGADVEIQDKEAAKAVADTTAKMLAQGQAIRQLEQHYISLTAAKVAAGTAGEDEEAKFDKQLTALQRIVASGRASNAQVQQLIAFQRQFTKAAENSSLPLETQAKAIERAAESQQALGAGEKKRTEELIKAVSAGRASRAEVEELVRLERRNRSAAADTTAQLDAREEAYERATAAATALAAGESTRLQLLEKAANLGIAQRTELAELAKMEAAFRAAALDANKPLKDRLEMYERMQTAQGALRGQLLQFAVKEAVPERRTEVTRAQEIVDSFRNLGITVDEVTPELRKEFEDAVKVLKAFRKAVGEVDAALDQSLGEQLTGGLKSVFDPKQFITGIATNLASGIVSAAATAVTSALASGVSALFGKESPAEIERKRVVANNTAALERLGNRIVELGAVLHSASGRRTAGVARAAAIGADPTVAVGSGAVKAFLAELKRLGLTFDDAKEIAAAFGLELQDNYASVLALNEALKGLRLNDLFKTISGQLTLLRQEFQLFGTTDVDQLRKIRDLFLEAVNLPSSIEDQLKTIDLSSDIGLEEFRKLLQQIFSGAGELTLEDLGDLSPDEFFELLAEMGRLTDSAGAFGDQLDKATSALRNVPTGFKIALRRFNASVGAPAPGAVIVPPPPPRVGIHVDGNGPAENRVSPRATNVPVGERETRQPSVTAGEAERPKVAAGEPFGAAMNGIRLSAADFTESIMSSVTALRGFTTVLHQSANLKSVAEPPVHGQLEPVSPRQIKVSDPFGAALNGVRLGAAGFTETISEAVSELRAFTAALKDGVSTPDLNEFLSSMRSVLVDAAIQYRLPVDPMPIALTAPLAQPRLAAETQSRNGPVNIDRRTSVVFEAGAIVQQPGEDGEALAKRVGKEVLALSNRGGTTDIELALSRRKKR